MVGECEWCAQRTCLYVPCERNPNESVSRDTTEVEQKDKKTEIVTNDSANFGTDIKI